MKINKRILYAAGGILAVAAIGAFTAPKLSAAIKAAFVEVVIPSKPYFVRTTLDRGDSIVGPDTGTLGVTSITLTNSDASPQTVSMHVPYLLSGPCATGAVFIGAFDPSMLVTVQGNATLHLNFPSPLTFYGAAGHTCLSAGIATPHTGTIDMVVNGFIN